MREEIIGSARLILGDARDFVTELQRAPCVLTDPPYGINYQSGHATKALWVGGDRIKNDQDASVRDEVLGAWVGCSTPRIVFGSRKVKPPAGTRMVLIWDKGPALGMGDLTIPWKPSYEEIYVLGSGYVGARDEGAVLYCPPVQSMAKNGRLHPNEKPVTLLRRLLKKMPDGMVADPFMGSGSCGEAAALEGRPFVGCEVVEAFFDIACRRIEAAQRQSDLFVSAPVAPKPVTGDMFSCGYTRPLRWVAVCFIRTTSMYFEVVH